MSVSTLPLENQVAVITGASRGIGRSIASRLAADGADLVLSARGVEGVETAAREIEEEFPGRKVLAVASDVSSWDSVKEMLEHTTEACGRIDLLINNAGITRDGLLLRMNEEDWDEVLATNLKGVFNTCRLAARQMLRQRSGRIVNVTSVVGMIGNAGQANYAASKGGVIAFTRTLARELAARGILVNAVAPGFIETDMTAVMTEEAKATMGGQIPLGRIGVPDDVAALVAFLCGPGATYIIGEVIRVDGGLAIGS